MRYMILVKAACAAPAPLPPEWQARMARFRAELARAGVLLEGMDLGPGPAGWRVDYPADGGRPSDGPPDAPEVQLAGFSLIEVRSREEALAWSRRFPAAPRGGGLAARIELCPVIEPPPAPGPQLH
ncbi:YciI family protein [Pelomonas sp. CA6]|uniref:YciI family protein n=1 Tax=Pelomonas sp. CA6 TaxID=2907999 RepID=UPI001F4C3E22|nr:YciI family protein [Pelomonas sp. CA6]MCH7343392.1 YciI family protein [Pelomonas sp. CA6]